MIYRSEHLDLPQEITMMKKRIAYMDSGKYLVGIPKERLSC